MKTIDLGKVSIVPRGAYSASETYMPLDIVTHEGSGYLVLKECSGVTPENGEYYQLMSRKGDKGEKGDKGDTGPQGATGSRGATGSSGSNATINGYNSITLKGGTGISVTNSGSTCTISSTASSSNVQIAKGSYTGSGSSSKRISIGFQPKVFFLNCQANNPSYLRETYVFVYGLPKVGSSELSITWSSTGITLPMSYADFTNHTYYWAAIG